MKINTNEISALIKEQIKNYEHRVESNDIGTVITVGDGIALVYGLDKAMLNELLIFPGDVYGMVLNLEEDHVGAVLLGNDRNIKEGDTVKQGEIIGRSGGVSGRRGSGLSTGPHLHFFIRFNMNSFYSIK